MYVAYPQPLDRSGSERLWGIPRHTVASLHFVKRGVCFLIASVRILAHALERIPKLLEVDLARLVLAVIGNERRGVGEEDRGVRLAIYGTCHWTVQYARQERESKAGAWEVLMNVGHDVRVCARREWWIEGLTLFDRTRPSTWLAGEDEMRDEIERTSTRTDR